MIVLVFLLWMFAAILFFTNPKNETTRLASLIAFFGGLGGFGVMLGDGPNRDEWILWTDIIATSLSLQLYFRKYVVLGELLKIHHTLDPHSHHHSNR